MENGLFVSLGEREVKESTQDKHWREMQAEVCGGHPYFTSSLLNRLV